MNPGQGNFLCVHSRTSERVFAFRSQPQVRFADLLSRFVSRVGPYRRTGTSGICPEPAQRATTGTWGLPGGAVELDSARGRPQTCTVCNNSDSRSLLAHPHFFFRAPFPLTVGTCLDVCILCTRLSKVTGPAPRSLFAFYLLTSDIVWCVTI